MNDILEYSFLSWTQFFIIAVVAVFLLLIANKFHLFERHTWDTSIGYHMFFCVVLSIVVIAFLLIRPIFHVIFLLVIFGFIYKNIFAYVRSIFNLYFSNIHMGDKIRIDKTEGRLTNINMGGMHISSKNEKAYFPFNNWKGNKIVLLSEAGRVPVSMKLNDEKERNTKESILSLEKSLFEFPYLAHHKVNIRMSEKNLDSKALISSSEYKESMIESVVKAGFSIKDKK